MKEVVSKPLNPVKKETKEDLENLLSMIDGLDDIEPFTMYAEIYYFAKYTLEMFNIEEC